MNEYLLPTVCCLSFVLMCMRGFKSIRFKKIKDSTYNTLCRVCALVLSYVAVVLSYLYFNLPVNFGQTFLYTPVVYVLQESVDLEVLKRIVKKKIGLD